MTDLLTLPEAALYLNKSGKLKPAALRRAIVASQLPAGKFGGKWMVTRANLDAYVEATTCRAAPAPPTSTCENVPDVRPSGLSVTDRSSVAQAAARIAIAKLERSSRPTSRPNTRPHVATISPK